MKRAPAFSQEDVLFTGSAILEPPQQMQLFPLVLSDTVVAKTPMSLASESLFPPDIEPEAWLASDRKRTSRGVLALSLNVGVDPPDVIKRDPCAYLECWLDPFAADPEKSVQQIGEALVKQYEFLQPRAKYIACGDPQPEILQQECKRARRAAGTDRVLFHFNGHGVPTCTANGELWFFNEDFTQYLPVSLYELMHWLVEPSIYVFDCNGAGHLLDWYKNALIESTKASEQPFPSPATLTNMSIMFGSCGKYETLPSNPDFPADVFTSCLTTPIRMALTWHVRQRSMLTAFSNLAEVVNDIPGQLDNRRTPLGELYWIFTAITDAIAYTSCSPVMFQKLFREDTLLASICRNFLLAERVLRSSHITPVSLPALPPMSQHPLWNTWDLEIERCVAAHALQKKIPNRVWQPSSFFEDQLGALVIWTERGEKDKASPAALSCLLQALLSQSMREKALWCLARYMDLGAWAVARALALGVFPYLLKLLKSGSRNLRAPLMIVWAKVIALEPRVIAELGTKESMEFFLHALASGSADDNQRVMACFVLAQCCAHGGDVRSLCLQGDVFGLFTVFAAHPEARLRTWCALAAGFAWRDSVEALTVGVASGCLQALAGCRNDPSPRVRAAVAFAIGSMRCNSGRDDPTAAALFVDAKKLQHETLLALATDGCPAVRYEAFLAISKQIQADPVEFRRVAMLSLQAELENVEPAVQDGDKSFLQLWSVTRRASVIEPDARTRSVTQTCTSTIASTLSSKLLNLASPSTVTRIRGRTGVPPLSTSALAAAASSSAVSSSASLRKSPKSPRSLWRKQSQPQDGTSASVSSSSNTVGTSSADAQPPSPRHNAPSVAQSPSTAAEHSAPVSLPGPLGVVSILPAEGNQTWESECAKVELRYMQDLNITSGAKDPTDPKYIIRANLQLRHTQQIAESSSRFTSLKRTLNTLPRDRERARLRWNAGGVAAVSSICFAPGPPELICVARGNALAEWRDLVESSADGNVDDADATSSNAGNKPARIWETEVDVSSIVALNSHNFPLWATGSLDGTVRVWGRPVEGGPVAPLMSSFIATSVPVREENIGAPLVLAWDAVATHLSCVCGSSSTMDLWDLSREMHVNSFDLPASGSSLSCATGSWLSVVGTRSGHVVLFDSRVGPSAVHTWQEHSSIIVEASLFAGSQQSWTNLMAGSVDGSVLVWDMRAPSHSSRSFRSRVAPLHTMAVHPLLGQVACGASDGVSIHGPNGSSMSCVKYFDVSGQPLGSVECVAFNPLSVDLAVGLHSGEVLILSNEKEKKFV